MEETITDDAGTRFYYLDGLLHRDNEPAVIRLDGTVAFWQFGKLSRLDGAAVIKADGTKEYWIDNIQFAKEEFEINRNM